MDENSSELLTAQEAAEMLRVTTRQLERWRWERTGPRFARLGRQVVYRPSDLRVWLDQQFAEWDDWQVS